MARPKLGEGETQRLHVMISTEELEAIEDWRFANRIASRSEAVRRLVQVGMLTNRYLLEMTALMVSIGETNNRTRTKISDIIGSQTEGDVSNAKSLEISREVISGHQESNLDMDALHKLHWGFLKDFQDLSGAKDIATASQGLRDRSRHMDEVRTNFSGSARALEILNSLAPSREEGETEK